MTEELKEELDMATYSTQQAYLAVRGGAGGSPGNAALRLIFCTYMYLYVYVSFQTLHKVS